MTEKRRARINMIVLKHGKISKGMVRKKLTLSPLGTGKGNFFERVIWLTH